MAYGSRRPEGVFFKQVKARQHQICMGSLGCGVIKPGDIYIERRTRVKGRPTKYCRTCAEARFGVKVNA